MSAAPAPRTSTERALSTGIVVLLLTVAVGVGGLLAWHSLSDTDIWLHLALGRDFLADGGIPRDNHYSFTEPGHVWTNHEWLFQCVVAVLGPGTGDGVAGWSLLRLFLALALLGVVWLGDGQWARLRRIRTGQRDLGAAAWAGLPMLAGLGLLWPRLTLRPELISFVAVVLLVRLVERATGAATGRTGDGTAGEAPPATMADLLSPRTAPGAAFLLVILWSQFHGFSAMAPAIWVLGLTLAPVQRRLFPPRAIAPRPGDDWPAWRRGSILVGLSLLALLLTPNGLAGLTYPLRALGQFFRPELDLRYVIAELVPLLETQNSLGMTILLFRASLVWAVLWIIASWGRVSLLRIALFMIAAAAALASQRNIGIYAVAFCLLHTGATETPATVRRFTSVTGVAVHRVASLVGVVLTLAVVLIWVPAIVDNRFYLSEGVSRRFGDGMTPAQYPLEIVDSIAAAGSRPKVCANVGAAGYVLARSPARLYIDGRTEAYSTAHWRRYGVLARGGDAALTELQRSGSQFVALAINNLSFLPLAQTLLATRDWRLAAAGEASLLFRFVVRDSVRHVDDPDDDRERLAGELSGLAARIDAAGDDPVRRADRLRALASMWKLAGRTDRQQVALRRGLHAAPDHPLLHHNLGNVLMEQGRFADALAHFDAATRHNRRATGSWLNKGVCLYRQQRWADAAHAFETALHLDPARVEAWVNLAQARRRLDDRRGSLAALERAAALAPDDPAIRQMLLRQRQGLRR